MSTSPSSATIAAERIRRFQGEAHALVRKTFEEYELSRGATAASSPRHSPQTTMTTTASLSWRLEEARRLNTALREQLLLVKQQQAIAERENSSRSSEAVPRGGNDNDVGGKLLTAILKLEASSPSSATSGAPKQPPATSVADSAPPTATMVAECDSKATQTAQSSIAHIKRERTPYTVPRQFPVGSMNPKELLAKGAAGLSAVVLQNWTALPCSITVGKDSFTIKPLQSSSSTPVQGADGTPPPPPPSVAPPRTIPFHALRNPLTLGQHSKGFNDFASAIRSGAHDWSALRTSGTNTASPSGSPTAATAAPYVMELETTAQLFQHYYRSVSVHFQDPSLMDPTEEAKLAAKERDRNPLVNDDARRRVMRGPVDGVLHPTRQGPIVAADLMFPYHEHFNAFVFCVSHAAQGVLPSFGAVAHYPANIDDTNKDSGSSLTQEESLACSAYHIPPVQYLRCKKRLFVPGAPPVLTCNDLCQVADLDWFRLHKLLLFFREKGWIDLHTLYHRR